MSANIPKIDLSKVNWKRVAPIGSATVVVLFVAVHLIAGSLVENRVQAMLANAEEEAATIVADQAFALLLSQAEDMFDASDLQEIRDQIAHHVEGDEEGQHYMLAALIDQLALYAGTPQQEAALATAYRAYSAVRAWNFSHENDSTVMPAIVRAIRALQSEQ